MVAAQIIPITRAPEPPPVSSTTSGSHAIRTEHMQRVLGKVAWTVWVYLCGARDRGGWTRARNRTIAEARHLSHKQVARACARLKRAGLLVEHGWLDAHRNKRGKLYARRVLGDYRKGKVTIPLRAWKSFTSLGLKGGKRRGAGRPPSSMQANAQKAAKRGLEAEIKAGRPQFKAGRPRIQSGYTLPCDDNLSAYNIEGLQGLKEPLEEILEEESSSLPLREEEREAAPGARRGVLSFPERSTRVVETSTNIDAIADLYVEGGGIIPHYPTVEKMAVPKLPSPPLLPDDSNDLDCVLRAITSFKGAVEHLYKVPCPIFAMAFAHGSKKYDIRQSQHYPQFVKAVRLMKELQVRPAAWCVFAIEVWKNMARSKAKPPSITFVLNAQNITKWNEWFRSSETSLITNGGRRIFTKEQDDVLRRYSAVARLRQKVLRDIEKANGGIIPVEEARRALQALVDEWFPGGFDEWLTRAREKGEQQKIELAAMIAAGEYVWD